MAKLLVHESAGVREFEIVDNEVHMGRELDNTLRLPDPSISRHHCVLRKVGGGYEIQDLQSSNGVLVNGNRVQSSPLRNGDRITLGQIQLTFQDPLSEVGVTAAVSREGAVQPPLGTVRMSADELAAIHTGKPPAAAFPTGEPQAISVGQSSTGPAPVPVKVVPPIPPVPPPSAPRPASGFLPEQSFLGSLLPPIPDDAVTTGERGDLVTRLVAVLIDVVPAILISIVFMVLSVVPYVGCILLPLNIAAQLGYYWFFVPWCVSKYGASIGKKVMKLRVVPEGKPQGRIDLGPAILRQIGNFLFLNLIVLAVKGDERISLSDMLAKSEVLKVDR
ncbi:FHA domain-containing protein [Geothrix fuzhouensis]|uniref:FHA domain-containing protein n=1 Tax=Geothrix fuzhouensis TaxID=2966451 RepID=UPI0021495547|nr:FHA domain-containing protein [Geothrix fuzhouensis]